MNSTFGEMSHGFLKSKSVPHSVECRRKSAVVPNSSSSQFLMGVTSTATEGPKLFAESVTLRNAAAPTSTTARSSSSLDDCADAFVAHKSTNESHARFLRPRIPHSLHAPLDLNAGSTLITTPGARRIESALRLSLQRPLCA